MLDLGKKKKASRKKTTPDSTPSTSGGKRPSSTIKGREIETKRLEDQLSKTSQRFLKKIKGAWGGMVKAKWGFTVMSPNCRVKPNGLKKKDPGMGQKLGGIAI